MQFAVLLCTVFYLQDSTPEGDKVGELVVGLAASSTCLQLPLGSALGVEARGKSIRV